MNEQPWIKLSSQILDSTIWSESHTTVRVWITMLASADRHGRVMSTVPGLARRAAVTIEECEVALQRFEQPDRYSRTRDHEGRRIVEIDGGWLLLNHSKYRDARQADDRREQNRKAKQRQRETLTDADMSAHVSNSGGEMLTCQQIGAENSQCQHVSAMSAHAEADTDKNSERETHARAPVIDAEPDTPSNPPESKPMPKNARAAIAMRSAGADRVNPSHPELLAALAEGCTPEELADVVAEGVNRTPPVSNPFLWAITTARNRRSQVTTHRPPVEPDKSMLLTLPGDRPRPMVSSKTAGAVRDLIEMAGAANG